MWDEPLIALLSIIKDKIKEEDIQGALNSIDTLIIRIEGWYEEWVKEQNVNFVRVVDIVLICLVGIVKD